MLKIENVGVTGWEDAICSIRKTLETEYESDSCLCKDRHTCDGCHFEGYVYGDRTIYTHACNEAGEDNETRYSIGNDDYRLMMEACNTSMNFMKLITVTVDVTAPLYWWQEFDNVVRTSFSTTHKIADKEFTSDDFSIGELFCDGCIENPDRLFLKCDNYGLMKDTIKHLNFCRELYQKYGDKKYWYQLVQLLPVSYNQKRTIKLNYSSLLDSYKFSNECKLDEWFDFYKWIETLPYSELITRKTNNSNPVEIAYRILLSTYNTKDIDKDDALVAIEEAIGYLGEALE